MKYIYILIILIFAIFLSQCKTKQVNKDLKSAMEFLSRKAMDKNQEKELEELELKLDQGLTLYKANCSGCHGIFTKGKDDIPNFSKEQIDNYGVAFIRQDPKNHAVAMKLSSGQINKILTFLHMRNLSQQIKYTEPKE